MSTSSAPETRPPRDAFAPLGPHAAIGATAPKDRFLAALFDRLWDRYRERVAYVRTYEEVVRRAGGTFVNDHIALRTVATQVPASGIAGPARIFEALGYRAAGCYDFPDKHLSAVHLRPPHPDLPKVFVSELRTWELPRPAREAVARTVASHRPPVPDEQLAELAALDGSDAGHAARLLDEVVDRFHRLPWEAPLRSDVRAVDAVSQYAAWVLVHGWAVNHFTALVDSHGTAALDDIEKTVAALRAAGVPTKAEIEGARGSDLRQTATEAVPCDVPVRDESGAATVMPWSYAYFELAERPWRTDAATGRRSRFDGFLGPQATQLFEMTRTGRA